MHYSRWIFPALVGFVVSAFQGVAASSTADMGRAVAVVNDKIISRADLDERISLTIISSGLEDAPQVRNQLKEQVLKLMIDEILQLQIANKFEIKISDAEVEAAFDDIEHRNNMPQGELRKLLQEKGIPLRIMREQLRAGIAWREYVRAKYGQLVQVSDEEVARKMAEQERAKAKTHYLIAELFLPVESAADEAKVKQQALQFMTDMRKGAHFSALAREFSQAPSAPQGGDIGWIPEGSLDPALEAVVKSMVPNDVSMPVRTQDGYYLLMLRGVRPAGAEAKSDTALTFAQALFPLQGQLSDEKIGAAMGRAKKLTSGVASCGHLKALAKDKKDVEVREVNDALVSEMVPQLRDLLLGLGLNRPSEPILTDIGVIVFMVCNQEEVKPEELTLETARLMLQEEKINNQAQREIRDLRRNAHIDMRM
ncbi:MAG: peptidylprolyl isomerase [Holosporales bacterium]